jgi:hypothetical protein
MHNILPAKCKIESKIEIKNEDWKTRPVAGAAMESEWEERMQSNAIQLYA